MLNKFNLNNRIFTNIVVQLGSKIISFLLSLLTISLLTRHLGTDGYGNFTLIFTYFSLFVAILDFGFNQIVVREFTSGKYKSDNLKASLLNLKLILNVLSIIMSLIILPLFPYSFSLKIAIIIGALTVAMGNMISYGSSILQSRIRLDLVALIDLIVKFSTVIVIYLFVKIQGNLFYIIGAVAIGNFIGLFISYFFVRKDVKFKIFLDISLTNKLLKLGIPVGISTFLSLSYFKVDTLMLSILKSPSDVGIYSLSYKLLENIVMLWGLYMASVYPLWAKYYNNSEYLKYKLLLTSTLKSLIVFSIMIIFIGQNFTFLIMRILGGSKFFSSMEPFRILLWAIPFIFLNNIFYNMILSFGKTKYLIHPLLLSLIINILLNLYAIPKFGYLGTSITTVITEIFISLCYILIFWKNLKLQFNKYV